MIRDRFKAVIKAFVEQGISSVGNFLFFFALARLLGPQEYGLFSAVWVAVSLFIGVTIAWVNLPINSVVAKGKEIILYGVCLRKIGRILLLIPMLLPIVLAVSAPMLLKSPFAVLLAISLCGITVTVEFLRCYLIRRNHKIISSLLMATKWTVSLTSALLAFNYEILSPRVAMACLILGNAAGVIVILSVINRFHINIVSNSDRGLNSYVTSFSRPLLFQGIAGSLSGILTTFIICRWIGIAAYGAYQALQSLCNILSPLMQMTNTHYPSYLTHNNTHQKHTFIEHGVLVGGFLITCLAWCFRESFIRSTIGPSYLAYAILLPFIVFQTTVLLANSLISAQIRVTGQTKIFYFYSLISLFGSIMIAPVAIVSGSIMAIVIVVLFTSSIQFILLKLCKRQVLKKIIPLQA